ncbi:MAG: LCP family protein [Romboutsia sp.]
MSNKTLKVIVGVLVFLVIVFPLSVFGMVYLKLDTMHDSTADESILSQMDYKNDDSITNILLCGTDGRPGETNFRTDAMMILTVDNKHQSLKLTSLARDTYIYTPDYGNMKLTETYAYGGINLLTETIESNFEIDINNYAIVDFYSFMDIVETLGGITVDVKENEISELNKFIPETYKWDTTGNKGTIQYIKSAGEQKLNGYQILSYSRIRKGASGGALERDRRQREVIEGMMQGIKELSISKYPKLIDTMLPYVKTNMKPTEIMNIGGQVLGIGNFELKQLGFPINDGVNGWDAKINGKAVLEFEPDSIRLLQDFIFEDGDTTENDEIQ